MKIKLNVSTGCVGSERTDTIEIDDEQLEEKTENEKEEYINDIALDWLWNNIDFGWHEA